MLTLRWLCPLVALGLLVSCADWSKKGGVLPFEEVLEPLDIPTNIFSGYGVGEACTEDGQCRNGLLCVDKFCAPAGNLVQSTPCALSVECGDGLICGPDLENLDQPKQCIPEGEGGEWDICSTDLDCKKGFFCKVLSFTGSCTPEGDGDVGAPCDTQKDCFAGLGCSDGKCGMLGFEIPLFAGETCQPTAEVGGDPRVFFEIPRGGVPVPDFYRLPFPNDIRTGKHLDLAGHPTPGDGVVQMDVAKRIIDVAERDLTAFGTNPIVFFRFSVTPNAPKTSIFSSGADQNLFFIDVTDAEDPTYGESRGLNWLFSPGRQQYICHNFMAIYLPWSRPLDPGHKYAVILKNTIKAEPLEDGGTPRSYTQADDFKVMLSNKAPTDPDLLAAWNKYEPLRSYLVSPKATALGLSKENVLGAAVFSTYDPRAWVREITDFLKVKGAPPITQMVLCDTGVTSPCDDGLTGEAHVRGCFAASTKYYEFQGKARVPVFQSGKRPYFEPKDGGRVKMQNGMVLQTGVEEVCFSLTIPKGATMPAGGWPIVVYAHGTGGNFRSHVTEGVVEALNKFNTWNTATTAFDRPVAFAVLGFDQVMHGARKGDTQEDPDSLVFNFRNPQAALGNFLQGVADNISFVALAKTLKVTLAPFSVASPATADPASIFYMGHSQGGTTGPLFLPWATDIKAAVLSGSGGGLTDSLLRKVAPVDIRDGVIMALQDESVSRTHPVLALLQMLYEPVDPINFGEALFHSVEEGEHAVRTLHVYGLEDMHTPPVTIRSLAQVMRADLASAPSLDPSLFDSFSGVQVVSLPKSISRGLTVEYGGDGTYTGHFVVFKNPDAIRHYTNFFGTAALDAKPTVVQ